MTLTHVWRWRTRLAERHGQACRVVARGRLNSALVAFADGEMVVTSRWAVRRITTGESAVLAAAGAERWTADGWRVKSHSTRLSF